MSSNVALIRPPNIVTATAGVAASISTLMGQRRSGAQKGNKGCRAKRGTKHGKHEKSLN